MGEESAPIAAAAASIERRSGRKTPPLPKAAPWLVVPYGKGKKNQAFYNICEPNNRTIRKSIPELNGKKFWQKPSHKGWLIILCRDKSYDYTPQWNYGDCFLWNPSSFETVQLPSLLHWIDKPKQYELVDCVLSSPPTLTNNNQKKCNDSMVFFAMYNWSDETSRYVFLYCNPEDQQWRSEEVSQDSPRSPLSLHYLRDKLYAMENMHSCLEIEVQNKDDNNVNLCIRRLEPRESTDFPCEGGSSYTCLFQIHFMESCDEIYRIDMCQSPRNHREIYSILVARLDFSLLEWKEVKKFGDLVLFRGQNSTACCSASELGLTYGCLYYTLPGDLSLYKFELPSNGVAVILPCLKLPQPWFLSDWIMIPDGHRRKNTLLSKDEEETDCIQKAVESNISPFEVNETEIENQGRNLNGGELEEEAVPWDILDMDSVELISNHLHRLDYIHFRLVRKANRAIMPITKLAFTSTARIEKTTHLSPWLLFCRDNIYNFINPKHDNENYLMNLPDLVDCTIRFQKGGWLLLTKEDHKLFFYNPLTRENIQLPSLPDNYCFSGITFSSTPTSSDCIVFGIEQSWPGRISIYFIKRGEQVWNIFSFDNVDLERYHPLLSTPVIKDMAFYFVDYNGTLGVFSLEDNSWKVLEKPRRRFSSQYPSFLVECEQDIFLVKLEHLRMAVGIFRLNFSKMVWDEVENLGKHMLFISYTSCFSAVAPNCRMENKIFFPRLCLNGEGVLFYSLETGSYRSFGSEHSANSICETEGGSETAHGLNPIGQSLKFKSLTGQPSFLRSH